MNHHLRHDYSLADLHRLAATATRSAGPMGSDWLHRYGLAWSAIAEELYTVDDPPHHRTLVLVGRNAIFEDVRDHRHHHGYFRSDNTFGPGSSPAFWKYWWPSTFSVPSCEEKLVERHALIEIMLALSPVHREVLVALAVWDDPDLAATALGISQRAFVNRICHARANFRALWHEGERAGPMFNPRQSAAKLKREQRERERVARARADT